jgi:hypothetical protein
VELSDEAVRRMVGGKSFDLRRGEVLRIMEVDGIGLCLYGSNHHIFVPAQIDGYDEIRAALATWMNV